MGTAGCRRASASIWFCARAADCQRALEVRATAATGGIVATVRACDDGGDGVAVEGASGGERSDRA